MTGGFSMMQPFLNDVADRWNESWCAGTYLTIDESMIGWQGAASAHLTYLPRKPTPLGLCLKTICDSSSGVMLEWEFVDCKEEMAKKDYVKEYGNNVATTIRLCEKRWAGSHRIVIGDSWFGSLKAAVALK